MGKAREKIVPTIYEIQEQANCADGNQVSGCFEEGGRLTGKGHEGVSRVIGNILHLDWNGGYMVVYICQNA